MLSQVAPLRKLFVAPRCGTNVRSDPFVELLVSTEVEMERETLRAPFERAGEGAFARMHQSVSLQLALVDEHLVALIAAEGGCDVRAHQMFAQRSGIFEHFGAFIARNSQRRCTRRRR